MVLLWQLEEETEKLPRPLLEVVAKGYSLNYVRHVSGAYLGLLDLELKASVFWEFLTAFIADINDRSFDELEAELLQGQKLQVNK